MAIVVFTDSLKRAGITITEEIVRRIMKSEKLIVPAKHRKYSSYKGEISSEVENIIDGKFHAEKPNEKWLTNITEFAIPAGKVYLSPIIDCFDGMVASWNIGTNPNSILVNNMLDEAVKNLKPNDRPIVHSDRGCHYRWPVWIEQNLRARYRKKDALLTIQPVKAFLAD